MSSAKKGGEKFSSCLHVRKFLSAFFHRAKPVSEMERSGIERHCGVKQRKPYNPSKAKRAEKARPAPSPVQSATRIETEPASPHSSKQRKPRNPSKAKRAKKARPAPSPHPIERERSGTKHHHRSRQRKPYNPSDLFQSAPTSSQRPSP